MAYGKHVSWANLVDVEARLKKVPSVVKSVDSDLEHLAKQSAQNMQEMIGRRGTKYSHERGRAGRVESGAMQNDVTFRKAPNAGDTVFLWEFGWVDSFMKYYFYQERGFHNVRANVDVEGMFALKDAGTEARMALKALAAGIIKKAVATIKGPS